MNLLELMTRDVKQLFDGPFSSEPKNNAKPEWKPVREILAARHRNRKSSVRSFPAA